MNPEEITQIDRYRVVRFISEGGFAWVFEVVDPKLRTNVGHFCKQEGFHRREHDRYNRALCRLRNYDLGSLSTLRYPSGKKLLRSSFRSRQSRDWEKNPLCFWTLAKASNQRRYHLVEAMNRAWKFSRVWPSANAMSRMARSN